MSTYAISFNRNFTQATNAKLAGLIKHEPANNHIRTKRSRKSSLDPHLPEILKWRDRRWSFQRITNELKAKHRFVYLNKSSVMRRVNSFYGKV